MEYNPTMVEENDMLLLRYWLSEFKRKSQNLCCQRPKSEDSPWVFWSDPTSSSCNRNWVPPEASTSNCAIKIIYALQMLKLYYKDLRILIQYWAPTTTTIGGRCSLKTSNQPFALTQLDHKLLDYRMCSLDNEFNVDDSESEEDLGFLGRVFRHRSPEMTPNVQYYSSKEYPQRKGALRCGIQWSLALPMFEPSSQCCVGVLELLSTSERDFFYTFEQVCWGLEKVGLGLKGSNPFIPVLEEEIICDEGLLNAFIEIREVLTVVCKNHELPLAQTWVPLRNLSAVAYNVRCRGEIMSTLPHAYYISDGYAEDFQLCTERLHLQKGQGVVGRAYMSHNSCFCGDVTQFSITDYPLAHLARYFEFASCFAICLRSEFTGDSDYVLEFFFPPGKTDSGGNQQTLLKTLLATMKQHFRSFKIASGKDLGDELDVEFVDFRMVVDSFQIRQTATRSPPWPEPFHNVGDMMQLHSSDQILDFSVVVDSAQICQTASPEPSQHVGDLYSFYPQLMVEDDAIQNQRNVVSAEQIETAVTSSEKEGTIEIPETKHITNKISISYQVLKQHFGRKLEDAAESLSVSRSTLKRICRQHGVNRWPSHKRNKKKPPCSHPPPEQAMATIARTVTIKAEYINDIVKFQLSSSSTMIELEEIVSHRLKLNVGTFKINYKDDDDWILISCNEDLQYCITTSRSLGNTTITMLVQPITD